ncbi:MAG: sodium:proton antiporter, partial [Clostridia bacterium]|nr:sodium:proton antiporter [Clostridia bacterium]
MDSLILLIVFLPFFAAVFSYLIGRKNKDSRNFFVLATAAVTLIFSIALLAGGDGCSVSTTLLEKLTFRADSFRSLYAVVMGVMWTATSAFSLEYFSEHYRNRNRYYFFLLLTLGAAMGVFLSSDLFTAFVFFEILSFTSFTWVIHDETPGATRAANTYLGVAVIGGLVLFMGLALLYHTFGTLNIESLSQMASAIEDMSPLYAARSCSPAR